jgi:hypothetical protein
MKWVISAPFWVLIACEQPEEEITEPLPTAFERDLAPKLIECTGCHHDGDEPSGALNLNDFWVLDEVESSQIEMPLITPGNHLDSYLWHKVAGTHSIAGGLGQRMPLNVQWSQEDVDLLALWIDLGLPE